MSPTITSVLRSQLSVRGYWKSLGASKFVLSIIREVYKTPIISTPLPQHFKEQCVSLERV